MDPEFQKALDKARKLELDGIAFYTKAAELCHVPSGRRMFESFAGDEKRHLKVICDVAKGLGVDMSKQPLPRDEIRTLFTTLAVQVGEEAQATADEHEAIRVAMGMETESYKLYKGQAETASDESARKLFERLSHEENQHYEMLENTLEYLTDNQKWFLWKEWALIVGDQSSLGME
jgi:rubrerythrin